jgi:hypothetical protein
MMCFGCIGEVLAAGYLVFCFGISKYGNRDKVGIP